MKAAFASVVLLSLSLTVEAQSNLKESSNSFARYSNTGDIKQLESAKKFIDDAYKTKRDTTNSRNNILRALIYSSLAYADSTQKIKTPQDPIIISKKALAKIRPRDKENFESEINYINQNLTATYIYRANKFIEKKEFDKAYENFLEVDKLGAKSNDITNNLALLASQAGKTDDAILYYKSLIEQSNADVDKYLALAKLYKEKGNNQLYLNTLQDARAKFENNKEVLFLLIQTFAENKFYPAIVTIIDEAIKYEPNNIDLYYLGGYANESSNNIEASKKYYDKVLDLDENNFDANLALGLIYLNEFLSDKNNLEAQYNAQTYLLTANSVKPYAVNALKGLALYYETTNEEDQLDRVNVLLNQLSNN
ncbi:tetratricopeptide repeat protein [Sphingobacterium rhinopitheci]|uniref:tetratricopeptide repeat protein n=1 Tax=Sphingobacterium rhinopitheci TaxID=2781960 RepID=UPI001F52139C|nr:hypothetical protein [Sphingobacterium rhinopitheci]MCI0922266.1 hypothetical protein [Sphingobacterium rhinopitheci]